MDVSSRVQVEVIREVSVFLRSNRIRFWLRGGWALDFILGGVTREHGDIDLVTWKRHRGAIRRLFPLHGFSLTRATASNLWFQREGVDIAVDFIVKARDATIRVAGFETGEPLFLDSVPLEEPPKNLAGITCRVFSVGGLIRQIERTPAWLGRPMRPKDADSLAVLRELREGRHGTNADPD